ncbi:MAG: hypothetical protein AAF580_02120 [Pseudomonadota bacterium]
MSVASDQLDKEAWETAANKIAKALWAAEYRAEHPGISPTDLEAAWHGDTVRTKRKLTKTALKKLEKSGVYFVVQDNA